MPAPFDIQFDHGGSTHKYRLVSKRTSLNEASWFKHLNALYDHRSSPETLEVCKQVVYAIKLTSGGEPTSDVYECIINEMLLKLPSGFTPSGDYPSITFSDNTLYVVGGDEDALPLRIEKDGHVAFSVTNSGTNYYTLSVNAEQSCDGVDLSPTTGEESYTLDIGDTILKLNKTAF